MIGEKKLIVLLQNAVDESVHTLDENFAKQVSPLIDHLAKKAVDKTEFGIAFLNNDQAPDSIPAPGEADKLIELKIRKAGVEFVLTLECNNNDKYLIRHDLSTEEIALIGPDLKKLPDFLKKHTATFSEMQNSKLEKLVDTLQFL